MKSTLLICLLTGCVWTSVQAQSNDINTEVKNTYQIRGQITQPDGDGVSGVKLTAKNVDSHHSMNNSVYVAYSDASGRYTLEVPSGSYVLELEKKVNSYEGINEGDLNLIIKMVLNEINTSFYSKYAADWNNDKNVRANDFAGLKRFMEGREGQKFTFLKFFDRDIEYEGLSGEPLWPFVDPILVEGPVEKNFYAVKKGDVNHSGDWNGLHDAEVFHRSASEDNIGMAPFEVGHPYPNPASDLVRIPLQFYTPQTIGVSLADALGRTSHAGQFSVPEGSSILFLDFVRNTAAIEADHPSQERSNFKRFQTDLAGICWILITSVDGKTVAVPLLRQN